VKALFARRSIYLQGDSLLALILAFGTFLSRFPFRSRILYHWDSVNFAYAMREFSVAKEQPHPPGYIVYVWLCRAVDLVFHDAQVTMVWISIVASVLSVVALFYLGRAMFDRRVGLIAALLLASSPLFWFYGEIALPHTLDTFLVILAGWLLYQVMLGQMEHLIPAAITLAIASGVRQQTLIFLALLGLFAVRSVGVKRWFLAAAVGALICLTWFVPLIYLSGGISDYFRIMSEYNRRFQSTTSVFLGGGWWGIQRNVRKLAMYTVYGWSVALIPCFAYGGARLWRRGWPRQWERIIFLALWVGPALVFYTIIHMGQQGLVFVFLPPLLICSAVGLVRLLSRMPGNRLAWLTTVLVGVNLAVFCLAPEYPLGGDRLRLLTRTALVNSDRYYGDRFAAIQEHFAPESTAILAANWHHVEYYLPEYPLLPFGVVSKWEQGEGELQGNVGGERTAAAAELGLQPDEEGQTFVIVFDTVLEPFNGTPDRNQQLTLKHGDALEFFTLTENKALRYGADSFGVIAQ
jgi:hypothetical protein